MSEDRKNWDLDEPNIVDPRLYHLATPKHQKEFDDIQVVIRELRFLLNANRNANKKWEAENIRLTTIIDSRAEDLEVKAKYEKAKAAIENIRLISGGSYKLPVNHKSAMVNLKAINRHCEQALKGDGE